MLKQLRLLGAFASGCAISVFTAAMFLMAGCQTAGTDGSMQTASINAAPPPTLLSAEQAAKFGDLSSEGYKKLDEGDTEGALAAFAEQVKIDPNSYWGYYNTACVYGRNGDAAKSMEWLTKAVDHGMCDVNHMSTDTDVQPTWDQPGFAALTEVAQKNYDQRMARFKQGMPGYDKMESSFADKAAFEENWNAERDKLKENRNLLSSPDYDWARLDYYARRAASLRDFYAAHPEAEGAADFNYERERLWALEGLLTIWGPNGELADAAMTEAIRVLNKTEDRHTASLAHFVAGKAEFCKERPGSPEDANWIAVVTASREHLVQVAAGTEAEGRSEALKLYFDLAEAGETRAALQPRVSQFVSAVRNDEKVMDLAADLMQGDLVKAMWPLEIDGKDVKGKKVSLADYKGKTLMIDFWATWCGPCRRELPHIKDVYAQYKDKGFEILSISLDYADRTTIDDYKKWIKENGMTWRHIYDQQDWTSPLVTNYLVTSIPSPFLVDKNGELAAWGGELRGENLAETVKRVIETPPMHAEN